MRTDVLLTAGALLVAVLVVTPAVTPVGSGIVRVADELTQGTFRPFGKPLGGDGEGGNILGGLTGSSEGGYVPGAGEVPDAWLIDRNGDPGEVVIDYVFEPALGSMKRLKAFDRIGPAPDYRMTVSDPEPRQNVERGDVFRDRQFRGSFDVDLKANVPTLIFSPSPDAVVTTYATHPPVDAELRFLADAADNRYVVASGDTGRVRLNVTFLSPSAYHELPPFAGATFRDYAPEDRPPLDPDTRAKAALVLDRAGVPYAVNATGAPVVDGDVALVVRELAAYFQRFGEDPIPDRGEYSDTYLALALGGNGCCRHRAFAFATTLHALGAPARVVVNEAHAFIEVKLPHGAWHQVNAGGCGTYRVNNPNDFRALDAESADPRGPGPGEVREVAGTRVVVEAYQDEVSKGSRAFVEGHVNVQPPQADLSGIPVDVFLNASAGRDGVLAGTALTRSDGSFTVRYRVPDDVAAGAFGLTARVPTGRHSGFFVPGEWSEMQPLVVTSTTRLAIDHPSDEGAFAPFGVSATLRDATGRLVPDATLNLTIDEGAPRAAVTDARGVASWDVTVNATGSHVLAVTFAGTEYLHGTRASGALAISPAAIVLDAAPAAVRGRDLVIVGRALDVGTPVPDARVTIEPRIPGVADVALVRTDASGAFTYRVPVPVNVTAGGYDVRLALEDASYEKTVRVPVRAATTLAATAPETVYTEAGWRVTACVEDDTGAPVRGAPVELRLAEPLRGAGTARNLTLTNGCADLAVQPRAFAAGPVNATVVFLGTASAAPASRVVTTTAVAGAPPPPPPVALMTLAAGGVLAALAVVAVALEQRFRARGGQPGTPFWSRWLVGLGVQHPSRVTITFPDVRDALADAWDAAGVPLRVRVAVEERAGAAWTPVPGARVSLRMDDAEHARLVTDADGAAELAVPLPDAGALTFRALHRGSARVARAATSRTLRGVDYREEAERAYRQLVHDARAAGAAVTDASTPREVALVLAAWATERDARDLERAVGVFERVAFTDAAVTRDDAVLLARVLAQYRDRFRAVGGAPA